eukprot:2784-Heterococcus_DN1.PRE.2
MRSVAVAVLIAAAVDSTCSQAFEQYVYGIVTSQAQDAAYAALRDSDAPAAHDIYIYTIHMNAICVLLSDFLHRDVCTLCAASSSFSIALSLCMHHAVQTDAHEAQRFKVQLEVELLFPSLEC